MTAPVATTRERVFQPATSHSHVLRLLPVLVAATVVILFVEPDWEGRLILLAFLGVFLGIYFYVDRRWARKYSHCLRLDPAGLHYAALKCEYGIDAVPWSDIRQMDIFYGSRGDMPGPSTKWLRIDLYDGAFRRRVQTSISDRIFGWDVNIALDFDAEGEAVLDEANAFLARYGTA